MSRLGLARASTPALAVASSLASEWSHLAQPRSSPPGIGPIGRLGWAASRRAARQLSVAMPGPRGFPGAQKGTV